MKKTIAAILAVLSACFAVGEAVVCKNHNDWCHYMVRYGACSWNPETNATCPRSCGACSVSCPNIEPAQRQECGYYGITDLNCYHAGCCWDPLENDSKYPWCFLPKVPCPNVKPEERQECGYYGISALDCYDAGCCWGPLENDSKYPWCYVRKDQNDEIIADSGCRDKFNLCHILKKMPGCYHIPTRRLCVKTCGLC